MDIPQIFRAIDSGRQATLAQDADALPAPDVVVAVEVFVRLYWLPISAGTRRFLSSWAHALYMKAIHAARQER